jgi:hypothetical protein
MQKHNIKYLCMQTSNVMTEFVSVINTDQFLRMYLHECHRTYMYLFSVSVSGNYSYISVFIYTAVSLHTVIEMIFGLVQHFQSYCKIIFLIIRYL